MTEDEGTAPKKGKKKANPDIPPEGDKWTSPVCFDAQSLSQRLHESMEELGFKYKRRQADKLYQQLMVVMPLPKTAYVYRFDVSKPVKVWIDLYDTRPSHAGVLPYMDIQGLTDEKIPKLKALFDNLIKKLPRPPWEFTLTQRFQHGLIIPEWRRAKKAWRGLGYKI